MDIPNTFVAGTKAKAQEVNDNFTACKVAIDDNTSGISTLETQLSSGMIFADGTVPATKNLSYTTKNITGATNATPIVITSPGHGFITGDKVFINGVVGNTAANGEWTVTVTSTSQFELNNSVGNGTYTSGGTIYRYPNANENLVSKIYVDNNITNNFDFHYFTKQFLQYNDKTKLVIKAGTFITLDNNGTKIYYNNTADTVLDVLALLDIGTAISAGKDYYLYLVPDGNGGVTLKISLNSTYPTGYSAANSRKIGGFHTLCVNVGTISGHTLSGFVAGNILPASVWCLSHRPVSEPEGMAYIDLIDKWVDIYLQSGTYNVSTGILTTASVYGATVTDTRPWSDHAEDLFRVKKRMPTDIEFAAFAEGSNQKTSILGSAAPSPKVSGGHLDTASRRMISNYGLEDCCGYLWQWIDNPSANGGSGFAVHDAIAGAKGQLYGSSCALLAGGGCDNGSDCGSRCRNGNTSRSCVYALFGGRGVSEPLKL